MQRLDTPYVREGGKLRPASWDEALKVVAEKLKGAPADRIGAIAGDLAGAEEMFALKDLLGRLGVKSLDCRQDGCEARPGGGARELSVQLEHRGHRPGGRDPARRRQPAARSGGAERAHPQALAPGRPQSRRHRRARADLTYPYEYLGAGAQTLADVAEGKHSFAETLKAAHNPMVIVGAGAAARPDGAAVLGLAARIASAAAEGKEAGWNAFNVLHTAASRVAGLDLGFVPQAGGLDAPGMLAAAAKGKLDVLYLLGADEIDLPEAGNAFVIYQGSHGDRGAHRADVILPGAAYTEKSATFVNTEGRAQVTERAVFPPGDAKEDWAIVRALSAEAGQTLPYDTLTVLRAAMYKSAPQLARLGTVAPAPADGVAALAKTTGSIGSEPFASPVRDFYLTNPIARASAVMAEMSALKKTVSASQRLKAAE